MGADKKLIDLIEIHTPYGLKRYALSHKEDLIKIY